MSVSAESFAETVVGAIIAALTRDGESVWIATVVSTWGSSPRPPGSMLVWSATGGSVGSVSGGCVEADLVQKFRAGYFSDIRSTLITYGGAEPHFPGVELPCGGQLQLLIESVSAENSLASWQQVHRSLLQRQGVSRVVLPREGEWSVELASTPFELSCSEERIDIYIGPKRKLLIVGANPVATFLAQFAHTMDFAVTVCDPDTHPAESFLNNPFFEFVRNYPDGLVTERFSDVESAIVAVSHDPRLDDMALLESLPSKAFYVGAMGSVRSSDKRRERLLELGISLDQLHKLRAPIGIDIGSKTPAEIAVSIAADLVRVGKFASYSSGEQDSR